ncbi:hypothetical protein [Tautonia rosea]|uniref:hypothetical protein n=1 Tax=Tautonia rosea TaxID=2728037 RepID=UPI001475AC2A|nr:hypothetical protein [Tautonia rosea]
MREAKKINPDIKSSGSSDEMVFEHLREAIQGGGELADAAVDMLVDSEESGQQHIFLHKPKSEDVRAATSDAESIASRLFGADWRTQTGFPLVLARPRNERWADFRIGPTGTMGSGWTAKLYSGKLRWESQGKTPTDDETQIEVWKHRLSRDIKLVRWHADGMLELRVPQETKRNDLLESVSSLWTAVGAGLNETDFEPFNLNPACMKLIENHQDYGEMCRLGDARVQDEQRGSAKFAPPSGRDHLMSDVTREQAIRLYRLCNELVVTWYLDREAHGAQGELRTAVGKYGANNIHVRAKTTGKAIQHVTDQLRRLG